MNERFTRTAAIKNKHLPGVTLVLNFFYPKYLSESMCMFKQLSGLRS